MRKDLIKTGAEVMNKISGTEYRIKEVNRGVGYAYPLSSQDLVENECVQITEENAICFRFLRNPINTPIEDARLRNGKLVVNDIEINTGCLNITSILGTVPGNVILTVGCSGYEVLYRYNVDQDYFDNACLWFKPEMLTVYPIGDYLIVVETNEIESTDEDGEVTVTPCDTVVVFCANGYRRTNIPASGISFRQICKNQIPENEGNLLFLTTPHVVGNKKPDSRLYMFNPDTMDLVQVMGTQLTGTACAVGRMGSVIAAKDGVDICYLDEMFQLRMDGLGDRILSICHIPVIVDVTKEGRTHTFTFADPKTYETVRVQSVRTRDRGNLITIL